MKGAGLHPSVFFFITFIMNCVPSSSARSSSLTSDKRQKAELSYFMTRHSLPLPPNLFFFPITFPAMTKRGPLLYRNPFLI